MSGIDSTARPRGSGPIGLPRVLWFPGRGDRCPLLGLVQGATGRSASETDRRAVGRRAEDLDSGISPVVLAAACAGAGAVRVVPGRAGCRALLLGDAGRAGGAGVCLWDARRLGDRRHPAGGLSRLRPLGADGLDLRRAGPGALWPGAGPGEPGRLAGMGMVWRGTDTWSTAVPTARPRPNMVTGFGFGRRPGAKAGSDGSWPGRVRRSNGRTSSSGSTASFGRSGGSWLPRQFPADLAFDRPRRPCPGRPVSAGAARTVPGTSVLVPCGEIVGRAWARYYPIRERQLLR